MGPDHAPRPPHADGMVQTLTAGDDSPRPQPDSRFPWQFRNPDRSLTAALTAALTTA